MFVQIAPKVRVFLTNIQIEFVNKYKDKESFRSTDLLPEEIDYTLINNGTINDLHYAMEDIIFEEPEIAV